MFLNPEVVWSSEEKGTYEEGCLSIPEYYEEVERPTQVKVRYMDIDGKVHEEESEGLFATCIQHEIDHLNGVLFIDKMGPLARMGSKKDIETFIAEFEEAKKKGQIPPGTEMKL